MGIITCVDTFRAVRTENLGAIRYRYSLWAIMIFAVFDE